MISDHTLSALGTVVRLSVRIAFACGRALVVLLLLGLSVASAFAGEIEVRPDICPVPEDCTTRTSWSVADEAGLDPASILLEKRPGEHMVGSAGLSDRVLIALASDRMRIVEVPSEREWEVPLHTVERMRIIPPSRLEIAGRDSRGPRTLVYRLDPDPVALFDSRLRGLEGIVRASPGGSHYLELLTLQEGSVEIHRGAIATSGEPPTLVHQIELPLGASTAFGWFREQGLRPYYWIRIEGRLSTFVGPRPIASAVLEPKAFVAWSPPHQAFCAGSRLLDIHLEPLVPELPGDCVALDGLRLPLLRSEGRLHRLFSFGTRTYAWQEQRLPHFHGQWILDETSNYVYDLSTRRELF